MFWILQKTFGEKNKKEREREKKERKKREIYKPLSFVCMYISKKIIILLIMGCPIYPVPIWVKDRLHFH